jgi:hypothetical protein
MVFALSFHRIELPLKGKVFLGSGLGGGLSWLWLCICIGLNPHFNLKDVNSL